MLPPRHTKLVCSCCSWCITEQHNTHAIYPFVHTLAYKLICFLPHAWLTGEKGCLPSLPPREHSTTWLSTNLWSSYNITNTPKWDQSRIALLLASCNEPHLIDVCAVAAVAVHALRAWITSDTINRLDTSYSWVAGIGITWGFLVWNVCAHAYNKQTNKLKSVMSYYI